MAIMVYVERNGIYEAVALPSPRDLAKRMVDAFSSKDIEINHKNADDILLEIVENLGYKDAVDIFKESPKWYA